MEADIKRYLDVAREAAVEAGGCLRTGFGQSTRIEYKHNGEPVSEADLAAEHIVLGILREAFPEHNLLSEEAGETDGRSPFCWIVDPLDGTANYIHGLHGFGVSIALQHHQRTVVGVIYQPMSGDLFVAVRAHGAFQNGTPITVSRVGDSHQSLVGIGFGASLEQRRSQQQVLDKLLPWCGAIREPGSAVVGLCNVASGLYDVYCELGLRPWDVAAGVLLITEAGGQVVDLAASPSNDRNDILASNKQLQSELARLLLPDRMRCRDNPLS
ncbi:MAG: inositol monophosphatase [Chloroflexi bacterium]|nr:inositol monophosphatase [Chloroflexota bacterium]